MHEHAASLESDTKVFGFWLYLMTDLVIFGVLFACFIVFRDSTFGGPSGHTLFHMPSVLVETLALLISSFTCALALVSLHAGKRKATIGWLIATFLLGALFLGIELTEFAMLAHEGHTPSSSASLSSFFTLVGTHGTHIFFGLVWMVVCMFQVGYGPLSPIRISRVFRMALFWHFLDFVWIFIFTVVYGMGHLYA